MGAATGTLPRGRFRGRMSFVGRAAPAVRVAGGAGPAYTCSRRLRREPAHGFRGKGLRAIWARLPQGDGLWGAGRRRSASAWGS